MQNDLERICPKPAKFHMDWVPGVGLSIKADGNPVHVTLLTCFALIHISLGSLKGPQTPANACKTLRNALLAAQELYEDINDMTVVDVNELRKQADDADKQ